MPSEAEPVPPGLVAVPGGGSLLLDRCPGRDGSVSVIAASYRARGATCLVSLVEDHEFPDLAAMSDAMAAAGLTWLRLPIPDYGTPTDAAAWTRLAADLHGRLDRGETVVIHCWGGRGRSGMVAARLLAERGMAAGEAMARVRAARPGAIETRGQERWVAERRGG